MKDNKEDSYYFSDDYNEKVDNYDPVMYDGLEFQRKRSRNGQLIKILGLVLVSLMMVFTFTNALTYLGILFFYISDTGVSLKSAVEDKDFIVEQFLSILASSNEAEQRSRELTLNPHLAGHDAFDHNTSAIDYITNKFNEYGLVTYNETFNVSLNTPVKTGLKLYQSTYSNYSKIAGSSVSKLIYDAPLVEDELEVDPFPETSIYKGGWHGFSKNGTVKSKKYVFTNYGTLQDYKLLASKNISTEGAICISKYGNIFRGLKVKFAQEVGKCAAVVLYTDPGDDFYKAVDGYESYPDGPARNPSSIQRGSVLFLSDVQEKVDDLADIIPKIPSIPVSYAAIQPILKTLNGHGLTCSALDADEDGSGWCNGAVEDVDYFTGPAPESEGYELEVENIQDYNERQIVDIMGNLTIGVGAPKTERGYIVIGAHRDTWTSGAADPESGTTAILEILRALKQLRDDFNWLPKTDIVFASWDAEEYGLLGSNFYVSSHAKTLKSNALAYLNVDVACSGSTLNIQASPLLNNLINKVLTQIEYPKNPSQSLYDHFYSTNERIGSLGSGSDYTAFLEHAGIPSMDIGFQSGEGDPAYHYHSNYDSFYWMSQLQDPGYKYHNTISKVLGAVLLELSENELVQFQTYEYLTLIDSFFVKVADNVPESWFSYVPKSSSGGSKKKHGCHMMQSKHSTKGKKSEDDEKDLHGKKSEHDEKDFHGKKSKHDEKDFHGKKSEHDEKDLHGKKSEHDEKDFHGKKSEHDEKDFHGKKSKHDEKDFHGKKSEHDEKDFHGKKSKHDEKDFHGKKSEHDEKDFHGKKSEHDEKDFHGKKSEHDEKDFHGKKSKHSTKGKKSEHGVKKAHLKKGKKGKKPVLSLLELMNLTYDNILLFKDKTLKIDNKSEELNLSLKNYDWLPFWEKISLNYKILGQNMKLKYFERHFLSKHGLAGRPFFKHAIYAAGHNYGYAATELPGLQDALDIEDIEEFYKWLAILNKMFED